MGEGRKSTRSYNYVLTVNKDTNMWKIYKKVKICRHHPLPRNLPPFFRQSLWMEDAEAQVSLQGDLASEVVVFSCVRGEPQFKNWVAKWRSYRRRWSDCNLAFSMILDQKNSDQVFSTLCYSLLSHMCFPGSPWWTFPRICCLSVCSWI